jgi:hypothetical protein
MLNTCGGLNSGLWFVSKSILICGLFDKGFMISVKVVKLKILSKFL